MILVQLYGATGTGRRQCASIRKKSKGAAKGDRTNSPAL